MPSEREARSSSSMRRTGSGTIATSSQLAGPEQRRADETRTTTVAHRKVGHQTILMANAPALHRPVHPVRFVTAASLFDGHDAAINIMRRILQSQGAEVIHLGHNRSVREV